jgi:hypothetical protein
MWNYIELIKEAENRYRFWQDVKNKTCLHSYNDERFRCEYLIQRYKRLALWLKKRGSGVVSFN